MIDVKWGNQHMSKELIILNNVSKKYDDKIILENINISIIDNQSLVIVGSNGSGKSSLLRIIAGLSSISGGRRVVVEESLRISYVPEHFPKLSFYPFEYLLHMGKIQGLSKSYINDRVNEFFAIFNISAIMQKTKIRDLSKGSLQKVAVIQALLTKPDILILDEPLSGQDQESQEKFIHILQDLKKQGTAIVLACHEQYLVEGIADKVIVIENKTIASDSSTSLCKDDDMIIAFTIHDKSKLSTLESITGVVRFLTKDEIQIFYVKPECSDDILAMILNLGGSICFVNHSTRRVNIG